jgi:predicted acetyltransferase
VETRYFATSGWRVRIVNLNSTLEKIRPLLEVRLQISHLAKWKGQLLLDAGEQKALLDIGDGCIRLTDVRSTEHCLHGGAGIGRLLIGSDEPLEIIQQEKITCTGEAMQLAVALFPNLYPMLSQWDEC